MKPGDAVQKPQEEAPTCRCGHGLSHPAVETKVGYGFWGWYALLNGISGDPKKVTWRCRHCGEVLKVTKDPKDLEAHK